MLIFMDARVPPSDGRVAPADAEFLRFIDTLPVERGRLPPWSHWWGTNRLQRAIVDAPCAHSSKSDLPRLTRAWFDDSAEVPPWHARRCGYLRLSKTYAAEARDAATRGWPLVEIDGTHLDPVIEAHRTADAVLDLIDRVDRSADANRELGAFVQREPRR